MNYPRDLKWREATIGSRGWRNQSQEVLEPRRTMVACTAGGNSESSLMHCGKQREATGPNRCLPLLALEPAGASCSSDPEPNKPPGWGERVGADLPGRWNFLQDQQRSLVLSCTPPSPRVHILLLCSLLSNSPCPGASKAGDPQIDSAGWPVHRTLLRQPAGWGKRASH